MSAGRRALPLLLVLALFLGPFQAKADHYSGGSITYECLGANFYEITLDLYLDCSGAPLTPQNLQLSNDCGVNFTLNSIPLVLTEEVSQLCPSSLANSTCNGGFLQGIRHYQFVTTVFLSPCNDWTIAWNICCRSAVQNLVGTQGMYLEATVNNAGGVCDNSPIIAENSIPFVCVNDPIVYSPGISDPDGNTMLFQFISAQFSAPAPTNINYQPGFTAGSPIPGITLDPATGQLNFTPTVTGSYVVVLEVTTFDASGVPIGTVMRDFLFIVQNCATSPPVSTGLTNGTNAFIVSAGAVEVCDGVPFCVDIPFTDADLGSSITLTSNAAALLPGATFTVIGSNPVIGRLCWTPDPAFSPANIQVVANDDSCPVPNEASFSILVTVVQPPPVPPDAGTNGTVSACPGSPPVALFPALGGSPDLGGVWTDPDGNVHNGIFTPPGDVFGTYIYRVGNGCSFDEASITVSATGGQDPGTNGTLDLCSNGASVALITGLGGTPQAGGAWSGPSPVVAGNYNPATMAPGVYTYTVPGVAPCPAASATVTVTESTAPNAGTTGTRTVCSNGAAVSLIASLGGTPAAGGTWSGPSPVVGGNYNPATMDPGVYTYTVNGIAPCANATATVTVTENTLPNAGTNGTLTVCSNGASVSLIGSLGGTPAAGGTWSGPSAVVGGNYDPATMAPGVYTYTVTGTAPCANATATVTVTENAAPNGGTNGTLTICSNGAAVALNSSLGGTPAAGGTWSGPSAVVGGNYDPATMDAGVYTYTVTGVAPCANATATVTVTENVAPNAGTNGTLTICSNGAAVSLISSLGGTPAAGGTWSGPSAVVGGNYDPATMAPGVYTYTVTGTAPCANATATVTVTENAAPNAGTNGSLTICSNGAVVALISSLGGTPAAGGAWSGPSALAGGNYDPATMDAGVYTYTVTGVAPCANATATVTVTENAAPNAGTNGTLTICSNGAAVSLISSLGGTPAAGGTWSGPSAVLGGNYDPATMAPGVYTYTVTGTAPCANATATVTVTENAAPNAGTNGSLTICSNGAAVALISSLGGTPAAGGSWSGPSAVVGGNYDPATMDAGVYTYTVTGIAPCANATATVTVTENAAPNAGTNGTLTICSNGAAVALISSLGGTPAAGGTWSGPSAVVGGNYDPATMAPGVYTYTVTGTAPCANATATVTVTENAAPNAGTNGTMTVCSSGASVSLISALGGTPAAGGAWSGPSAVVGGNYDPATMDAGVYTYTVTGVAPCANATATVTVTENAAPNAGTNGALAICSNAAAEALVSSLGGTPTAGGAWSGPSAVVGGNYDPATMAPGVYTYTVTGGAPCANTTATVTVTENAAPNAGTNGTLTVCSSGASVSLISALGGTPAAGGTWTGPSAVVGGQYDPTSMTAGVYTYTLNATTPCVADQSTVTVTENAAADAGTNGTLTVCETGGPVGLIASLGGTPDAGGAWSGPSAVLGGNYDPTTMTPGVYTYTVTGTAPCTNATATVTVAEAGSPDAGIDGAIAVCESGSAIDLFTQLGGTPDAGGTWSGPSAVAGGQYDPTNMTAGVYTYTLNATAPCVADQSTVTVTENAAADAGTNGTLTVCETGGAVSLFASLGGTPDAGGAWSGPSAVLGGNYDPATMTPGVYTYTVTGAAPCTNATATVTVAETGSPDAGADGAVTVCESGASIDLFTQLGGTPDAGGTWSGPSAVVGSTYDPSTMSAGVYTYTLVATAPCPSASATIDVVEDPAQNAGDDATLTLCASSGEQQLFDLLGPAAEVGGNWSGSAGSFSGTFDPSTDPSGTYTYTFTATACPSDQATIQVTLEEGANAGGDASLILCSTNAPIALIDQLEGTPDATGTWTNEDGDVVPAILDPSSSVGGEFTYTVPASDDCPADQAVLTVVVNTAPVAGTSGSLAICAASTPVSLFDGLTGTLDAGGTWTAPDGGAHATVIDPSVDISGIYTYTVTALAPCSDASANVNVFIAPVADAGADATTVQCSSAGAFIMTELLAGTPEPDGVWRGPSGDVVPAAFAPESGSPGIYTYTVAAIAPCVDDVSQLTISISEAVSAGTNGAVTSCANSDTTVDLFEALGGTPDPGGSWTTPNGDPFNGVFDPASNEAGIYTYSVAATAPCPTVSAGVVVDVVPLPIAEFVVEGAEACTPVTITLSTTFQGGVSCSWVLWNGEQVNDCAPVTRTITDGGTYGATLIVDAGNGCGTDTLSVPELFTVFDRPTADFTYVPEVINTLAPDVLFNNGSENAIGYIWDIAGDTLTTEDAAYSFAAGVSGEYLVCLTAIASEACRDSICKVVEVEDGLLVHVPNAFTPDGVAPNDIFKPIMLGVEPSSYRFYIFDRWGQPLFETSDPDQGWNGLFADGTEVPIGVYVWKLVAKDRITTNRIERVGHVTLVR